MSREIRRVEPLPTRFVLADASARRSPLHGRVVFLALTDERARTRLVDELRATPGVRVAPGPSRVFAGGVDRPWAAFHLSSDVGLPALLRSDEMLELLRRLADELLAPLATNGDVLVDWSPQHSDTTSLAAIRSVYPDAVVVTEPAPGDAILRQLQPRAAVTPRVSADRSGAPARDRLIVIVGAGRSGTTWLHDLLLSYEDTGGLPGHETWMFHQLRHLWRNVEGRDGPGLGAWLDRDAFVHALRRYCDGVVDAAQLRHAPGTRFFVEKTPAHVDRLPEIAAVYPDAWVIHLVRDGRDVARSMSQVPFFDVAGPAEAAALWRRVMHRARTDATAVPRFREVRYEALHDDPAAVLRDIRAWIAASPADDPSGLAQAIDQRVSTHAGTANQVGPGSWRSLAPAALRSVYVAAGDELVRAGYASRFDVWRARWHPTTLMAGRSHS